jgi:hypothetical protein
MRRDSVCCSVRCRQARHRFTTAVGTGRAVAGGRALRLAYADPPYPGLSKRYYGDHPDFGGEVDHAELIEQLGAFDGWALSTSARALPEVLALCPRGVRVAAWVRGDRGGRSLGPLNAWEPVIYLGGRAAAVRDTSREVLHDASSAIPTTRPPGRDDASRSTSWGRRVAVTGEHDASDAGRARRVDALVYHAHPRLTDPDRVIGAKPAVFCRWVFDLLGAQPQDEFSDLFPGSGGVSRAWDVFSSENARAPRQG